jgi:hypothetical protein
MCSQKTGSGCACSSTRRKGVRCAACLRGGGASRGRRGRRRSGRYGAGSWGQKPSTCARRRERNVEPLSLSDTTTFVITPCCWASRGRLRRAVGGDLMHERECGFRRTSHSRNCVEKRAARVDSVRSDACIGSTRPTTSAPNGGASTSTSRSQQARTPRVHAAPEILGAVSCVLKSDCLWRMPPGPSRLGRPSTVG